MGTEEAVAGRVVAVVQHGAQPLQGHRVRPQRTVGEAAAARVRAHARVYVVTNGR